MKTDSTGQKAPSSGYQQRCMVCNSSMEYLFSKTFNSWGLTSLDYERCVDCGFVACATLLSMSRGDWEHLNIWFHSTIYDTDGDPYDRAGRLKGQAEVIDRMLRQGLISDARPMLDWGSGTGDLAAGLRDKGYTLFSYDQYITPSVNPLLADPLSGAYSLVTATAVFEHLTQRSELDAIEALVADDGVLGVHLLIPREIAADPDWVYLLPVHCAFHNWESMRRLMMQWGYEASVYCHQARMWFFFKTRDGVRQKVDAINATEQPGYLVYCDGFVSANGVKLPLDPDYGVADVNEKALYIGVKPCRLPANWSCAVFDVESGQLVVEELLSVGSLGRFDCIYSDMVAERMSSEQFDSYLQCIRAMLRPGGLHRMVTADLQRILYSAASGAWSGFGWVRKAGLQSSADYLNTVFRSWGHRYLYDEQTLVQRFVKAGYCDVERVGMMRGRSAGLYLLDREQTRLYVEARC